MANPEKTTPPEPTHREQALDWLAQRDSYGHRSSLDQAQAQVHATLAVAEAIEGVSVNLDYLCTELARHRGAT